ncbi:hypothetical protein EDS67_17645 [candidate division KSB1 bacterium]|nr:MAG: hypothetical protein EDS67_17645 [candidate division KSB1 bacterium]MCE7942350.1 hypothetical protein [Chlorobi bacterium CHB1]
MLHELRNGDINQLEGLRKADESLNKYLSVCRLLSVPSNIREVVSGEFQLLDNNGTTLWKESYTYATDDPAPEFLVSVNGFVCKLDASDGSISFRDSAGVKLISHTIFPQFTRFMHGTWSNDGQYFVLAAPDPDEPAHYQIICFTRTGIKQWRQKLGYSIPNSITIAPSSEWILVVIRDLAKSKTKALLLSSARGELANVINEPVVSAIFSAKYNLLVVNSLSNDLPQIAHVLLYELPTCQQILKTTMPEHIHSVRLLEDEQLIYVLTRPTHRQRNLASKSRNPQNDVTKMHFAAITFEGRILGIAELPSAIDSPPNRVTIHSASTTEYLVLDTGMKTFLFRIVH